MGGGRIARTALACALGVLAVLGTAAPAAAGPFDQLAGTDGCIGRATGGCALFPNGIDEPADIVARGNHVYMSSNLGKIFIFDRDPVTGRLTPRPLGPAGCVEEAGGGSACADVRALNAPTDMAISPDGTRLYAVLDGDRRGVAALSRDPATGNLTQSATVQSCVTQDGDNGDCGTSAPMLSTPGAVAVSPDGQDVYVAGAVGVNGSSNGWVTLLDVTGSGVQQHTPLSQGACAQDTVPMSSMCLNGPAMDQATGVAVSPDGRHVYVTSFEDNAVTGFTRNAAGELGVIAGADGCIQPSDGTDGCRVAEILRGELFAPAFASDQRLYVGGGAGNHVTLLRRNVATGGLTFTDGECASPDASGPRAPCADSADLFGIRDIEVAPGGTALVAGARFGRGMHLMRLAANGAPQPVGPPFTSGCLGTGGIGVTTLCTIPRGFAHITGQEFGAAGVALGGPFVYGVSLADAEDGPGIVAARRALSDPVCQDASVDVTAGQEVTLPLSCGDGDDDPIVRSIVSGPAQGTLGAIDQSAGRVTYGAPADAGDSTQSVTFRGRSRAAGNAADADSAAATITIRVAAAQVPPAEETPPPPPPTLLADRDRDGIPDIFDTSDASAGPTLAETVVALVQSGDVFVRRPGSTPRSTGRAAQAPGTPAGFVPVKGAEIIPVGSVVHTLRGRVALTSVAQVVRGRRQTQRSTFFDGIFQIRQARARRPVTELTLRSPNFTRICGTTARAGGGPTAAAAQRSSRRVSRLWGDGRGRFRTKGRHSAATVRGTLWLTEERCDGTLTRVRRGSVSVRDLRARRTVTVRAGRSYLARAQRAATRRRR